MECQQEQLAGIYKGRNTTLVNSGQAQLANPIKKSVPKLEDCQVPLT